MGTQKTLTILRHAKAEAGSAMQDDHDRALNERGVQAALAMGNYIERRQWRFDHVLCSTSRRTRQTLEQLHLQPVPSVDYSEKLYLASAGEILAVLSEAPPQAEHVLVVGHNPGLYQLAVRLAKTGDNALIDAIALKFPTCALASFAIGTHWDDIRKANGELLEFMTPKGLSLQDED